MHDELAKYAQLEFWEYTHMYEGFKRIQAPLHNQNSSPTHYLEPDSVKKTWDAMDAAWGRQHQEA